VTSLLAGALSSVRRNYESVEQRCAEVGEPKECGALISRRSADLRPEGSAISAIVMLIVSPPQGLDLTIYTILPLPLSMLYYYGNNKSVQLKILSV